MHTSSTPPRVPRGHRFLAVGALGAGIAFAPHIASHPYLQLAELDSPFIRPAPWREQHPWQLIEGRHWQIASLNVESVEVTDAAEGTTKSCPPGMVEVQGRMKVSGHDAFESIDWLQKSACVDWTRRDFPERCARFDRDKWLTVSGGLADEPLHFCIDRFEYPNRRGAYPWVMVDWYEARDLCLRTGKRLCNETNGRLPARAKKRHPTRTDTSETPTRVSSTAPGAKSMHPPSRFATAHERCTNSIASGRERPRGRDRGAGARSASTT
jgi:sulfatase modifying factor 1